MKSWNAVCHVRRFARVGRVQASVPVPDLFARGGRLYRRSLARCLPFSLLAVLAGQAPSVYLLALEEPLALDTAKPVGWYLVMALAVAINLWSWLVVLQRQQSTLVSTAVDARSQMIVALQRVPQAFALLLVAGVLVGVGLVLLVLPGVYLAVCWVSALAICALEDVRATLVLDVALRRVRGLWWYTAAIWLLTLIAVLGLFVVGGFIGEWARGLVGSAAPTVGSAVLAALFQPFVAAMLVVHHDVLRQASSSSNSA